MELNNIQETVERTIYHSLRSVVTEAGYLPDIENYDIGNADLAIAQAAQIAYQADIKTVVSDKGFAIELFNNSMSFQKGNLKSPRIVIETESFGIGELGVPPSVEYIKDGSVYKKKTNADILSDLFFKIRLVSSNVEQQRILHQIMINSLPRRGYIKRYTETGLRPFNNLFINYLSYSDLSYNEEGICEKIYRYKIPDINEIELVDPTQLAAITDIQLLDIEFI